MLHSNIDKNFIIISPFMRQLFFLNCSNCKLLIRLIDRFTDSAAAYAGAPWGPFSSHAAHLRMCSRKYLHILPLFLCATNLTLKLAVARTQPLPVGSTQTQPEPRSTRGGEQTPAPLGEGEQTPAPLGRREDPSSARRRTTPLLPIMVNCAKKIIIKNLWVNSETQATAGK